jgi:hypothetical protein
MKVFRPDEHLAVKTVVKMVVPKAVHLVAAMAVKWAENLVEKKGLNLAEYLAAW